MISVSTVVIPEPGNDRFIFSIRMKADKTIERLRLLRFNKTPETGKFIYDIRNYPHEEQKPGEWKIYLIETDFPAGVRIFSFHLEIYDPKALNISITEPVLERVK